MGSCGFLWVLVGRPSKKNSPSELIRTYQNSLRNIGKLVNLGNLRNLRSLVREKITNFPNFPSFLNLPNFPNLTKFSLIFVCMSS